MENSDYKNDNEAASGLAKETNAVGRVLMSAVDGWNNLSYATRQNINLLGHFVVLPSVILVIAMGVKINNAKEAAILQEMDKIQHEQVVDIGNGQYGAIEMSAEDTAAIRAQAEKVLADASATSKWETVCFDSVAYIVEEKGWNKSSTKAITAKIDPDTLMPERCEVTSPKM